MTAIFKITDGTSEVDLISGPFRVKAWTVTVPTPKGGGTWQQSSLSIGRQLVDAQFSNIIDTFTLAASALSQDNLIFATQELRRLIEKGKSYWTGWQGEPVWLVAKASRETNTRYALVLDGRLEGENNPYAQPFLQPDLCAAVFDDLTLAIEHQLWTDTEPTTGTCVAITGSQVYEEGPPWNLDFNGGTSRVAIPDNALIQDLHAANMTAEAWVYPDSFGEGNLGHILFKSDATSATGWLLFISNVDGLRGVVQYATQADSRSGTLELDIWQHVAMTYNAATRVIRLWVNGNEVSYTTQQASVGLIVSDVGDDLYLGNNVNIAATWFGMIGWVRVSDNLRYNTATFTVPERCTLPDIDGNTVGQWIGAENTGGTIDNQEGTFAIDGAQTNCTFAGCPPEYGRAVATCNDEVYVANKQNLANITHIFVSDGGIFSTNLAPFVAYPLFPAVPVVGDYILFGIDTLQPDSGPFASLVFDIGTAGAGYTAIWEYWNGAWVALTIQDNTNADGLMTGIPLDTTGVGSVHWVQPSDWVTNNLFGGITAYWVRLRVATTPGALTSPTQQNRSIYSIVWPYIEIQSTEVLGDIAALARYRTISQADHNMGFGIPTVADPILYSERVICGLRSLSRGESFAAYINLADEQNPAGITIDAGSSAFADDVTTPTGRYLLSAALPGVIAPVGTTMAQITLGSAIAQEYVGEYHVFIRAKQNNGSGGDAEVDFIVTINENASFSKTVVFPDEQDWQILDVGKITLPGFSVNDDDIINNITLNLIGRDITASGIITLNLYDVILVPVDEWSFDSANLGSTLSRLGINGTQPDIVTGRRMLDVDAITQPKAYVRAPLRVEGTNAIEATWQIKTSSHPIIQANASQRLWFLSTGRNELSEPWVAFSSLVLKQQRYLSMRGGR